MPIVGTTASGHISSLGLGEATISAVSLAAPDFYAVADHLDCASEFDASGVAAPRPAARAADLARAAPA